MIVKPDRSELAQFLDAHPRLASADLLIADLNGILRGKRVTPDGLDKLWRDGLCLPGSVFALDITGATVEETGLGFDQGDADRLCHPIAGTLCPVPWVTKVESAQVLMTMSTLADQPFFADPRQVLAKVVERLRVAGLTPVIAVELEFYLIDAARTDNGGPQPPLSPVDGKRDDNTQVYSMQDLDAYEEFLKSVSETAATQAIPADAAVAEYAPGQFEVNLNHRSDALRACDDAVLLKRIVRAEARRHGMDATFMAKPYENQAGSGLHLHVSMLDANGDNVFGSDDPGGSRALRHAAGGMLEMMAPSMALFAPNANSYRRFQLGNYAPNAATWGINNRTTALRIPAGTTDSRRIEHRVAGADANPYLVAAAVLAGAAWGLENESDPGAPQAGNAYIAADATPLPTDWPAALDALDASAALDALLGRDFLRAYHALRCAERVRFERTITPLEYHWYLNSV